MQRVVWLHCIHINYIMKILTRNRSQSCCYITFAHDTLQLYMTKKYKYTFSTKKIFHCTLHVKRVTELQQPLNTYKNDVTKSHSCQFSKFPKAVIS